MAQTSKIEAELLKIGKVKPKAKENRQDYLDRILTAIGDLDDDDWEKVSGPAQKWVNAGQKIVNEDKGDIPDFPDLKGGSKDEDEEEKPRGRGRGRDKDEEEEAEEEKPRGRRGRDKDEEEEEKPRGRRGRDKDEEEGEEEARPRSRRGGKDDDGDGEEEAGENDKGGGAGRGRTRGSSRSTKGRSDDDKPARGRGRDKDEEEEEKPRGRSDKGKTKPKERKGGAQVAIKTAVIKNPKATTEDIAAALEKKGLDVTPSAVSTIRSGTLQTLRLVKEIGMPKGDF